MRSWWLRNGSATMADRVVEFCRTFRPLEILKGLVLTGRHLFSGKIVERYRETGGGPA